MLRKTLGWVDETGEPIQECHQFSYREFEERAGVVHSGLQKAVDEALKAGFIRRAQRARIQTAGVQAKSASYELVWDEHNYTDDLGSFKGFYLQPSYIDDSGQNRIGRKNIPNVFFDYLVRNENRGVIRVVGTLLWYSIDWGKGGERRTTVRKSLRDLVELTQLAIRRASVLCRATGFRVCERSAPRSVRETGLARQLRCSPTGQRPPSSRAVDFP